MLMMDRTGTPSAYLALNCLISRKFRSSRPISLSGSASRPGNPQRRPAAPPGTAAAARDERGGLSGIPSGQARSRRGRPPPRPGSPRRSRCGRTIVGRRPLAGAAVTAAALAAYTAQRRLRACLAAEAERHAAELVHDRELREDDRSHDRDMRDRDELREAPGIRRRDHPLPGPPLTGPRRG
jgi:hypothetical protein